MQTKSIKNKNLELKVFAFSVDVVSFVKTLEKTGNTNPVLKKILKIVNEFYLHYLSAEDAIGEYNKNSFLKKSKQSAQKCLDLLQSINVKNKLLNEKVDLVIEVAELIKIISLQED